MVYFTKNFFNLHGLLYMICRMVYGQNVTTGPSIHVLVNSSMILNLLQFIQTFEFCKF